MIKWFRTTRRLRFFARQGIPVFLDAHGEACLRPEAGPNADPVVVVSVPKSGTYLFGELLAAVGVQPTDVHVATYGFQDLRFVSREFAINNARETFVMVPSEHILPLVRPGQYVVSHFPYTEETQRQLRRFKIIFTYRDLRDTLVSTMRWVAKKGQANGSPEGWESMPDSPAKMETFVERHGNHYLDHIRSMREWAHRPDVLTLSFEEMQGDFGVLPQRQTVQRILDLLGLSLSEAEITQAIQKTLGKETLTFSGKRSSRANLWSDAVEVFFQESGAEELDSYFKSRLDAPQVKRLAG